MNREIKFRIPHFDNKGVFQYFTYWGTIDHKEVYSEDCFTSPSQSSGTVKGWHQQYTGLKDKNGKEIYEGDIVSGFSNHLKEVQFKEVVWEGTGWHLLPRLGITFSSNIEVVGNIYQTPELLNKEQTDAGCDTSKAQ